MAACETLKNYSIFVATVRKYIKDIPTEMKKAISDKEFLKKLFKEYDEAKKVSLC